MIAASVALWFFVVLLSPLAATALAQLHHLLGRLARCGQAEVLRLRFAAEPRSLASSVAAAPISLAAIFAASLASCGAVTPGGPWPSPAA